MINHNELTEDELRARMVALRQVVAHSRATISKGGKLTDLQKKVFDKALLEIRLPVYTKLGYGPSYR